MFNKLFHALLEITGDRTVYYDFIDSIEHVSKKSLNSMNDIEINAVEDTLRKIYASLNNYSDLSCLDIIYNASELQEIA